MLTFDVVITTYNRPGEVQRLTAQILECESKPGWIIVVDSSDIQNEELANNPSVLYIRSSHKNQPYQRLLGAMASKADVVVFLDDDLIIKEKKVFKYLLDGYKYSEYSDVVGVTANINYHSSLDSKNVKPLICPNSKLSRSLLLISGVNSKKPGKVGRLGIVGTNLQGKQFVEFFYGPCMSFKRQLICDIIPPDLLAMYERKIGKGEDKAISMAASKMGRLLYIPTPCFYHPPNDSAYFQDIRSFMRRTMYSRLYLSKVYARLKGRSLFLEVFIFYYFAFFRILIAFFSYVLHPVKSRREKLKGICSGVLLTFTLEQKAEVLTPEINWREELEADLRGNGLRV